MPLRTLLAPTIETVQDQVLAAEERYWDAYELAVQGRPFAAIYLAGFTAECLLKTAAFRFDGAAPAAPIDALMGPAKTYGKARFPGVLPEAYHSLLFWVALLENKRIDAGRPLAPALLADLRLRADRAYATWWISMRYRASAQPPVTGIAQAEVHGFLEDVDWMRKNHSSLWS